MRDISCEEITRTVRDLCIQATCHLPVDVQEAIVKAEGSERSPVGKAILGDLEENFRFADARELPICQDTGMAVVFIKLPIEMDRTVMSSIIWNHLRQGKEDQSVLQVRLLPAAWISMPQI